MLKSRRERLLDEICETAHLQSYRATLSEIVAKIEEDGCWVYTDHYGTESVYTSPLDCAPIIRLSLVGIDKPLWVIWRLLHEYGHHLSGRRQLNDTDIMREELAWNHAKA